MSVPLHLPCSLLAWKGWEGLHEIVWIRVYPTCTTDILLTSAISPFQYPVESCLIRLFVLFSSFVPHFRHQLPTSKITNFQPLFVAMSSYVFRCQIARLQRWWLVWVAWPNEGNIGWRFHSRNGLEPPNWDDIMGQWTSTRILVILVHISYYVHIASICIHMYVIYASSVHSHMYMSASMRTSIHDHTNRLTNALSYTCVYVQQGLVSQRLIGY